MVGRRKRQLSKTSTMYVALGIVLITLMALIGTSAFMRTLEISVKGVHIYSTDEIIEASGVSIGENLLFINTQTVSQRIRNAMPFVNVAQVTRILPATVLIEITESTAIAAVRYAGVEYVIDSSGRVLADSSDYSPSALLDEEGNKLHLIDIRGLDIDTPVVGNMLRSEFGSEMKLIYVQDILAAFEHDAMQNDVSFLDVSNIVNVHFEYLGFYRVNLGGSSNLRQGNLQHNMERLPVAVAEAQARFPSNAHVDINMTDVNRPPTLRERLN